MSIRTKILDHGKIIQEQLVRLLIKFDKRISDLEEDSGSSYDDTEIKARIKALEDLGIANTLSDHESRITALENPQSEPQEVQGEPQE